MSGIANAQEIVKIDATQFAVKKIVPSTDTTVIYDINALYAQKESITKQKEEYVAQRDKELAEVDELILKAKEAGVEKLQ